MNGSFKFRVLAPAWLRFGQAKAQRRLTRPPILIGGCARSGTTLLAAILSAHPHIWVVPRETWTFTSWRRDPFGRERPKRIDRLYREILLHRIPRLAHRWCEKSPPNIAHIPEILHFFNDEVRVIHIVRDARDVCLSVHPTRPGAYWVPPRRWVNHVGPALAYRHHARVHTLRYEDLVMDNAAALRGLMAFLDEPLSPEVLDWYTHARKRRDRALNGPLQQLYTGSLGKWKDPRHAERVEEIVSFPGVRELLDQLGYE
ncbi:MAG: sulfotransferase [Candidatus Binatia bacterium]